MCSKEEPAKNVFVFFASLTFLAFIAFPVWAAHDPAFKIILTGPVSIQTNVCSYYSVESRDMWDAVKSVAVDTIVQLDDGNPNSGEFYSNSDYTCSGTPISYTTITVNSTTQNFYYKKTSTGSVTLKAWASLDGNRIFLIGGTTSMNQDKNQIFDPLTNSWEQRAPMPTARNAFATAAANGRIYVIGGYNSGYLNQNQEYDPVSNTWANRAPMPVLRGYFSAASFNGRIYAMGGMGGSNGTTSYRDLNQEYDATANTWATRAPISTPRYAPAVIMLSGKIYAIGGSNSGYLNANEEFDPASNAWATRAPMPTARRGLGAGAVNGRIYAVGGEASNGMIHNLNEEFDPSNNSWTTRMPMPSSRTYLGAAAISGKVYIMGGWPGGFNQYSNKNEEFNPGSNSWTTMAPLPQALMYTAAAAGQAAAGLAVSVTSPPSQISIGGPNSVPVGTCSPQFNINTKDAQGNISNSTEAITINLTDNGGGGSFYNGWDSSCSNSSIGSINFPTNYSVSSFYYRRFSTGTVNLGATPPLYLSSATKNVAITGPTQLSIAGPSTGTVNNCMEYKVVSKDDFGNPSPVTVATSVNLSTETGFGGTLHSISSCSGSETNTVSIAASTHTALFWFKKSAGGEATLAVDDGPGGLAAGSLNVTVNGLSRFVVVGSTSNFSGQCASYVVMTRNNNNQNETVSTAKTVYLTDGGAGGNFDTSPTCSSSYGSVNIPVSYSSTTFYYRKNSTATLTITADDDAPGLIAGSLQVVFKGPTRLSLSGPASPSTTACSLYSLNTEDDTGEFNVNVNALLLVNLSDSDANAGSFYSTSDANCSGTEINTATVPVSSSYADFRYKKTTSGSVTLTVSAPGLTQANLGVNIGAVATQLTWSGPTSLSVGQCVSYTIHSRDENGNLADVSVSSTVSLSDSSDGTFYITGTCTSSGSSLVISQGSNSSSTYYRKNSPGIATLTASAAGLGSVNHNVSVAGAAQLEIAGSTSSTPNNCLAYTVNTKTAGGQSATLSVSTTVTLTDTDSADGTFYSDTGCATSISNITIPSGYSSGPFYYKKVSGGQVTLTASAAGLVSSNINVAFSGPTKLAIEGPSVLITSACSSAFTVYSRSESNVNTPVSVYTYVELRDGNLGGQFYNDIYCTGSSISSLNFYTGYQSAEFRYRKNVASAVVNLQAVATGLSTGTFTIAVNEPVGATKISINGPTTISENTCSAYTITALNSSDSTAPVVSNTYLYLSGGSGGIFYSDSACNYNTSGSILMSSGTHLTSFYFKKSYSGIAYLNIDDGAAGLEAGNLTVTITAGSGSGSVAAQLSLTGPTYISANTCNSYTVNSKDSAGVLTPVAAATNITLTDNGGTGTFYSDTTCTSSLPSNQVNIPVSGNTANFHYKRATGGSNITLGASASGLTSASLGVTVTSGGGSTNNSGNQATRLSILGPTTLTQGVCSAAFSVNSQDTAYINANVSATTLVYLDDNGAGGTFYSDYSCSSPISYVTIYSGNNNSVFHYRKNTGGTTVNFKADDGAAGLLEGTLALAMSGGTSGGTPSYLSLSGPGSLTASTCGAYTVQVKDVSGNLANVTTALTVTLSNPVLLGTFYSDAACAASTTQVSIAAAMNSGNFYFKKTNSGSGSLEATATNLGSGNMYVTVTSGGGGADTLAPGQITNLSAQTGTEGVVILQWSAPGDDGFYGTASSYILKFSTVGPITSYSWYEFHSRNITELNLIAPVPLAVDTQQSFTATGLDAGKTYWWGIRAIDEAGNTSLISNSPSAVSGQSASNVAAADADGKGSASVDPANVLSCQSLVSTITFTVDAASITAGGLIAIRFPDNWSYPQTYCQSCSGYIQAVDGSNALHSSVTVISNPEAMGSQWAGMQVLSGKILKGGEAVRLVYTGWPQWQLANNVAFEVKVKGSNSGFLKKTASQPSVNVTAGNPARISFANYEALTLGAGQASPAIVLRSEDFCGNAALITGSGKTVDLAGKKGNWPHTADALASFASDSAFANAITQVTIPVGQSQASFYYKTTTVGSTQIEASYAAFPNTSNAYPAMRYLNVVSGSVGFSGVTVDNGTPGSFTSVVISPNGDGTEDFATINFTPSDPTVQWRVLISTDNFATNVFERYGSGSPQRSVVWDGKDFRTGRVLPNGTYNVRIDAGGGLGANSTLSIDLQTAFITGTVTLDGSPLSGAMAMVSGWPMAYGSQQETNASGVYKVYGLKAGSIYSVSVNYNNPETFQNANGSSNNISAALAGTTANIALGSPSRLRVNARLPSPPVYDLYGSIQAQNAAGTKFQYGSLHFAAGSLVSDSGGYSYAAAFSASASSWTTLDVTADTYTVKLDLFGFSSVEKQVFVGSGKTVDVSFALSQRANIYGYVKLPEVSSYGTWVSVEGTKTGNTAPTIWGGAWIPPSKSSAVYTLFGVTDGVYNLRAQAPGFAAVSTGPFTIASVDVGNPETGGADFPEFGAGAKIEGTVRVIGDSNLLPYGGSRSSPFPVYINAFNALSYIGSYSSPQLNTHVSETSSSYRLTGLDAGGSYQLTAFLDGFELDPPGPRNITVPSSGTAALDLTFRRIDAQIRLGFILPSGKSDYNRISVNINGPGIGNSVLTDVTQPPVGNFALNSSSAAYLSPLINNGFYTVTVFYHTEGISQTKVIRAVNGTTTEAVFDLSGAASFTLGGTITLNGSLSFNFSSYTVTISSIAGIVGNAGLSSIVSSTGTVISTSSARVEAFLEDADNFGKVGGGSVGFDTEGNMSLSRSWGFGRVFYGVIRENGSYELRLPPGVYRVKPQANLDGNMANGLEVAPQEKIVVVQNSNVSGVDFTLSAGVSVRGTLKLPAGVSDTRPIGLVLTNSRGEPTGFTVARLVNSNSATFEFNRVADGDYLIVIEDAGASKAYASKPKKITVKGASLSGQDLQVVPIGFIRGSLLIERTKADGSKIRTPVSSNNKNLLPKGLKITAKANPWFEGGIFEAKEENGVLFLDANNQFVIENVLAGVYDVKFKTEDVSYDSIAEGSINLAPQNVSAVRLAQGQSVDLATVVLKPAISVTGTCKDASGKPIANLLVGASPAQGSGEDKDAFRTAVFTNAQGIFTISGLSSDTRYYDFFVQPRGPAWARFLKGKELLAYRAIEKRSVDATALTTSNLNFTVEAALASIKGRLTRGTKALSYPSGSLSGFPAAAVFLQKDGEQPKENPLGDISVVTDADDGTGASFRVSGLSPGKYRLTAVSLGYASSATFITAAVGDVHVGTLTFTTGGGLSGSIAKVDGTSPNTDEIRFIAAISSKFDSVVFGSLTSDEQTKTITGYSFSGFTPGTTYQMMIQGSDGIVTTPEEGEGILFASASEEKTLNITWKLPKPQVFSKFKKQSDGSYLLKYQTTQALRKKTSNDEDLSLILTVDSGSGSLASREISNDRRQLSAVYTPSASETSFRIRFNARTTASDPEATDPDDAEFTINTPFTYQIGLDSYGETSVNNVDGGKIDIEGDAAGMEFQPGSFSVDVSSNVLITMAKTNEKPKPSQTLRYAPSAYTPGLLKAMAAAPDVSAMSAFYEILLPRGLSHRLSKAGTLTLSYSSTTVPDPNALNIYWFNEGANAYFIQNANRTVDTVNQTISISVDHLSTFVVLSGSQEIIKGNAFAGGEVEVFNFPNPFDLKSKTLSLNRATAGASITTSGTIIRFTLPAAVSGMVTIDIYNIAGEHVRRVDAGDRSGGNYYYVDWDGKNDSGHEVASGVYVGELRVGGHKKFFKMAVIK